MALTLASNAITFTDNTSLSSGIIGTAQLSAGAVTADKIASLPNNIVTTQTIANSAVTAEKMSGGQTGSAPVYGCRAWVNFDATRNASGGTDSLNTNRFIRASGNVSSVTKIDVGQFRINFTTPMQDTGYTVIITTNEIQTSNRSSGGCIRGSTADVTSLMLTTSIDIDIGSKSTGGADDNAVVCVNVFR